MASIRGPRSSSASASSPSASTTPTTGACQRSSWRPRRRGRRWPTRAPDARRVAKAVDTVFGLRQFEISGPMPATLGKSNNYPRSVMNRLGGDPARVVLEPVGGQSPQKLVTEAGNAIAAGDADVVMIMGSEPGSTARYFANRDDKPDFTEHVEGQLEDRGHQIFSYIDEYTVQHGLTGAPVQYGLLENARRARLGLQRRRLPPRDGRTVRAVVESGCQEPVFVVAGGALGRRDHHRHRRQPDDLRPVPAAAGRPRSGQPGRSGGADVGRGGASTRRARGEVGVRARPRRHGRAGDCWIASTSAPAPRRCMAVREALRVAGIGVDDIATFDLYSCFPFPVFVICEALGHRRRRPARPDAHRRTAVLRRPRQQLFAARYRRDCERNARTSQGNSALSAPTAAS